MVDYASTASVAFGNLAGAHRNEDQKELTVMYHVMLDLTSALRKNTSVINNNTLAVSVVNIVQTTAAP